MNKVTECKIYDPAGEVEQELSSWFATPGDADDFIFYWEEQNPHSEK